MDQQDVQDHRRLRDFWIQDADKRRIARLEAENAMLRDRVRAWAEYAFTHHGDDARLYNGLADLAGMTPTWVQSDRA